MTQIYLRFPPNPSPLRYFDVGGIPSDVAVDPDPKARCNSVSLEEFVKIVIMN